VTVESETAADITYMVTLGNVGNIAVNYIPLAALDGDEFGALIEERIIERIDAGEQIAYPFNVPKSMLSSGSAAFVLDREDVIAEISDHPESACTYPIKCGDINSDTYTNAVDIIYLVNYIFKSSAAPFPLWIADINGDGGKVTSADVIYMVNFVFRNGPAPQCSGA